jgi:formylglycine-generating enzyme required for sulfatase activity
LISWFAGSDYPETFIDNLVFEILADDNMGPVTPIGMVSIPAGHFFMGSPFDEPGRSDDEIRHFVTLTKGFYMLETEVTGELWDQVMGEGVSTSQYPKVSVSWDNAIVFCNTMSVQEGLTPVYITDDASGDIIWDQDADGYRLPTEAEWEYASRSGSGVAFSNGQITNSECSDPILDVIGWYCGNGDGNIKEVAQLIPNDWGLYDMHGNVWELCWDRYGGYSYSDITDPVGPNYGAYRTARGGDWDSRAAYSRSAQRSPYLPSSTYGWSGFRIVRTAGL